MKIDNASNSKLIVNEAGQRYEIHIAELVAFIDYKRVGQQILLTHTEVPTELEGQGVGSALVKKVLSEIKQNDLKLVPLCPFVAAYIQKHPEWQSLTKT